MTAGVKETISVEEKFWSLVDVQDCDDCWNWLGSINKSTGYGSFYPHKSKEKTAHTVSYVLHYGEIPKGKLICHKCNNKKCTNPKHLYVGTHTSNRKDLTNFCTEKKIKIPCCKLTETEIIEIRNKRKDGKKFYELAKEYGVSLPTISNIIFKKTWKDVSDPEKNYLEKPKIVLRFTKEEKEKIKHLYLNGEIISKIAKILKRKDASVRGFIKKNSSSWL